MTFKPAVWHPIALVLAVGNFAGAAFALTSAEPWHAAIHVGLGLAAVLWAERLKLQRRRDGNELQEERLDMLEAAVTDLQRELGETQERLDFAERMLAQQPEVRRVDPPHAEP